MTDQQDDLVSQLKELAAVIPDGATNRADAKTVTAALAEIERLTLERNDALDDYLRRHKDVIDMLRRATRAEDELARLRAHIETSDHAHACAVQEMSGEMERLRAASCWQPMPTAPKDGTQFIYHDECGAVSTCSWQADDAGFDWYDIHGDQIAYPARWIPMPGTEQLSEK